MTLSVTNAPPTRTRSGSCHRLWFHLGRRQAPWDLCPPSGQRTRPEAACAAGGAGWVFELLLCWDFVFLLNKNPSSQVPPEDRGNAWFCRYTHTAILEYVSDALPRSGVWAHPTLQVSLLHRACPLVLALFPVWRPCTCRHSLAWPPAPLRSRECLECVVNRRLLFP